MIPQPRERWDARRWVKMRALFFSLSPSRTWEGNGRKEAQKAQKKREVEIRHPFLSLLSLFAAKCLSA